MRHGRRPVGHLSSDEEYSPELEWEGREALEDERADLQDIWAAVPYEPTLGRPGTAPGLVTDDVVLDDDPELGPW